MARISEFVWANLFVVMYVTEMAVSALWLRVYWTSGFVIYRRSVGRRALSAQEIETTIRSDRVLGGALAVHRVTRTAVGFRERFLQLRYTPLMRGEVDVPIEGGQATVRGRLYWHVPALLLLPVLYGHWRLLYVVVPACTVIYYLIFRTQRMLFVAVERLLDETPTRTVGA